MHIQTVANHVKFLPMVAACQAHGIGKTTAYKLMKENRIVTKVIGRNRYVLLTSLYALCDASEPSSPIPK